jgi:alpha-tubulin suppressor-like RCC1 family protein
MVLAAAPRRHLIAAASFIAALLAAPLSGAAVVSDAVAVSGTLDHVCILTSVGGVKCWGDNHEGQLGDGTTTSRPDPRDVPGLTSGIVSLSASENHTCAVMDTGAVKCWGANSFGQLGDGTLVSRLTPTNVALTGIAVAVSAGLNHTCALISGGSVRCWGDNANGDLGDGTSIERLAPVDVVGLSDAAQIAADAGSSCAVTLGNDLKCWGSINGTRSPAVVASGIASVALGNNTQCMVTTAGAAKCWGNNEVGQVGDGTETARFSPVDVKGLSSGVARMVRGPQQTCAILVSGSMKCWGFDVSGQVGDGALSAQQDAPVDVRGLGGAVRAAAALQNFTCAARIDGELRCWGNTTHSLGSIEVDSFARTVSLAGAAQSVTFGRFTSQRFLGDAPFTLSATASSGLPVAFETRTEDVCSVSGSSVAILAVGICSIAATQRGDGTFAAAPQVVHSFHVAGSPPAVPPRLANISTRARVGINENATIAGFVIGGTRNKTVLVTVAASSLRSAGIADFMPDPTIVLMRSSDGRQLATNFDWSVRNPIAPATTTRVQEIGFAPANASEPALLVNLPPGAYTVVVQGFTGNSGVAVVGVFEIDHPETPLANISTRGEVLTGSDVMIGGFIIQGPSPQTVVVTGIGPALAGAGIQKPLADPTLRLVDANGNVLATNDDWGSAPNAADIQAAGLAPSNAKESAIMMTLPPGAYTAILSGVNGGTGVGIVAVYAR